MTEQTAAPSDAILTVPNLLTFFRLALIPFFVVAALALNNMGLAVAIAGVAFATDLVDGKIARRYGQVSKLGIVLDPLSDRLGLASGAAVLIVKHLAPLWVVLVVIGRDALLVLIGAPILKARGLPIPAVTRVGKYGSFLVSLMFGLFLASGIADIAHPTHAVRVTALAVAVVAIPLYYASGVGYARVALSSLKTDVRSGRADG
ncbi:MAG: CDP-alcohol phosphatidyltransferase family protein [Actinomycetota bacterium]